MTQQTLQHQIFVGSYDLDSNEGIHCLQFEPSTGMIKRIGCLSGIENPSYLTLNADRNMLYAVSERSSEGEVVAIRVNMATGEMEEVNRLSSYGDDPCYLRLDPSGKRLYVVNYTSGNIAVYSIGKDGSIGSLLQSIKHEGKSIVAGRQDAPHPHSIYSVPGTALFLVPDLGTDRVYTYRLDESTGMLALMNGMNSLPGSGPRHLCFHNTLSLVYVVEELSSTVNVCELNPTSGSLIPLQKISTLPEGYTASNTCSEIVMSTTGKHVYVGNRGHNSIAVFHVMEDGLLEKAATISSGGLTPRHFAVSPDSNWLVCANQDSNQLHVISLAPLNNFGSIHFTYSVEKPACVLIIPGTF